MSWKCSVARFPKDPTGVSSTALPIGLPKSHRKPGNFSSDRQSAEIGQLIPHIGSGLGEPRPHGTVWLWARPSHRVATLVAVGAAGATCDKCGAAVVGFRSLPASTRRRLA